MEKYKCPACDTFLTTKFNLRIHFLTQHPEDNAAVVDNTDTVPMPVVDKKKKIESAICAKRFTRKANVADHCGAHEKEKSEKT